MYLPECIKMVITPLVIDIFFMKLAPLDSAHIKLSIHAKNSIFMKYPEWPLFSEQVTFRVRTCISLSSYCVSIAYYCMKYYRK